MGIFERKIEKSSKASKTVVVCLDGNGASERDALFAKLANVASGKNPDGRVSKSPTKPILDEIKALEASVQDALMTFEIVALTPERWSQIKRGCPPAKDSVSQHFGFNVEVAVQQALLESATVVDGDERETLTKKQWEILFSDEKHSLSGGDWERLSQAVIGLNQASYAEAIARGKA